MGVESKIVMSLLLEGFRSGFPKWMYEVELSSAAKRLKSWGMYSKLGS